MAPLILCLINNHRKHDGYPQAGGDIFEQVQKVLILMVRPGI
jgi:hypothetical protein